MNLEGYELQKFTPMMQQYLQIKKDYTDVIVFFRLGDFYEMFFDDAIVASRELEIQLTGKDCGQKTRVPMCGIPFHAYEVYATKLVEKGYKIAIVEQVEDAKATKGIVKRDVVKILTPGTCVLGNIENKENNYIASIKEEGKNYIFTYIDVTTGDTYLTVLSSQTELIDEVLNLRVKEVVLNSKFNKKIIDLLTKNYGILISNEEDFELPSYLGGLTIDLNDKNEIQAFALLVNYIIKTQREKLTHLKTVTRYERKEFLKIDIHSKRNLEITETLRLGQKNGSLLALLDKCHTAMGSRMMRKWLEYPLIDRNEINNRLDYTTLFLSDYLLRKDVEECLKTVYDLERIVGRISCGNCNAKDLAQLRRSLSNVPQLKQLLVNTNNLKLVELSEKIDTIDELYDLLVKALVENPPLTIKEGGMFNPEYNSDLLELTNIKNNSRDWILQYEINEREKTGIRTLKVGFNNVFGYYIEVSKSFVNSPMLENYERKQTLANAERFITPELKEYESKVLSASDKIVQLEYDLFLNLKEVCASYIKRIQTLADKISEIDCLVSFANLALKYNYVRPTFSHNQDVIIIDGRHPVVENVLGTDYVVNDVIVNKYNTLLITGPNMSGKSTYMRMLALIAIMAQIGCYVPASKAQMPIYDQIFTRIGASDDLIGGASTFMVEMQEANYALSNATKNSLILFDEIGRGTATFDGLALAQAIVEYVHEKIGCTTLFSTHYHELVRLEESLSRLKNIHVSAKDESGKIIFLHKVKDGPVDKSYGINVAALAKLPKSLIARSKDILEKLESENHAHNVDLTLFNFDVVEAEEENVSSINEEIIEELDSIDVNNLTPMEAFNIIIRLKQKIEE